MPVALQIIAFLFSNKDTIKQIVIGLEDLAGDLPGSAKAQAVKDFIAKALSIESQVEQSWPIAAPIFNAIVSAIKAKKA
jgi:hypothetical protein